MSSWDVVVVGAGTAGAAAAAQLARRGLRTLCVDGRALDDAGARWVNAVPAASFDAADVARPEGAERCSEGHTMHLFAGWGPERVVLAGHGVIETDMRLLVARLHALAVAAGAELRGGVRVTGWDGETLQTSAGPLRARWVVDASGLAGAPFGGPKVAREDLCAASQEVRELRDPAAARAYFEALGVTPGDTACFTGVAGGYSVVNVRLEHGGLSILTGSIPARGHRSGVQLLHDFLAAQPWVGERRFGGARAIPLGRPPAHLVSGRLLRLGDAAGQVFSAHGSGIGAGLVAARLLADALAREAPHDYAVAWQRRYGGTFAAYDVFRRFSETLSMEELRDLMRAGLIDSASAEAAMQQTLPALGPRALLRRARAVSTRPRLALRFLPAIVRMGALSAAYAAYPGDARAVDAWDRLTRSM